MPGVNRVSSETQSTLSLLSGDDGSSDSSGGSDGSSDDGGGDGDALGGDTDDGGSGPLGDAAAPLSSDAVMASPGELNAPFPFQSLVLAFLLIIPLNFHIQIYGSTILSERLNRRGELFSRCDVRPLVQEAHAHHGHYHSWADRLRVRAGGVHGRERDSAHITADTGRAGTAGGVGGAG